MNINFKNQSFLKGILAGVMVFICLYMMYSFKPVEAITLPQSPSNIKNLNSSTDVYRLNVDNAQYIVVVNNNGGTSIVRHR
jgi:hypothetical protein